ncbi:RES family NAD+ phosphorylase [uncultured Sphingomonas sp.]|uniref:RES family NAD+ phosphorylase n=1 Tax=uncultured Sphingomonas sp. TaxID=158754 RepID=UPI0035C9AA72
MPPLKPHVLGAGTVLHRIHRLIHGPIFFGPPSARPEQRFDDPEGVFKVLYLAFRLDTAFAETLVRVPTAANVLSTEVLARGESEIATTRPVQLYPLNARLSAHRLTLAQVTSSRHRVPQRLSREIHEAHPTVDGIFYSSRFDGGHCVALFDRARDAIATTAMTGRPLTPELAARIASQLGKNYVEP